MQSDEGREFESFLEGVQANEEQIQQLVAWEVELAVHIYENELSPEAQAAVDPVDVLQKIDDVLDRIWDWMKDKSWWPF